MAGEYRDPNDRKWEKNRRRQSKKSRVVSGKGQRRHQTREKSGYPDDWDVRRKRVLRRDSFECQNCGVSNTTLHVHHETPISQGGGHELSNLVTVCADCHAKLHDVNNCDICGLMSDKELLETSPSGGGPFYICDRCFGDLLDDPGCGICTRETKGKYSLSELGPPGNCFKTDICKECRRHTNYRPNTVTEAYFQQINVHRFGFGEDNHK